MTDAQRSAITAKATKAGTNTVPCRWSDDRLSSSIPTGLLDCADFSPRRRMSWPPLARKPVVSAKYAIDPELTAVSVHLVAPLARDDQADPGTPFLILDVEPDLGERRKAEPLLAL